MPRPLTQEEFEALSKDLNEVLIKHNAEMGVKSAIELLKSDDIESSFVIKDDGNGNKTIEDKEA